MCFTSQSHPYQYAGIFATGQRHQGPSQLQAYKADQEPTCLPLLGRHGDPQQNQPVDPEKHRVSVSVARRLYVSHFLSTWNSRVFEFGAVLYLAAIFPGTLMSMSVYALVRGLSAIVFAPAIGLYIDTGNRLQVVRVSIVFQRLVVAGSCAIFYVLALVTFFACVEKLCSIMNLVSVEKDWIVVVAEKDSEALSIINAQMRRIDLLCKLFGPLFIAMLDGYSSKVAIMVNFGMNAVSILVEYFAIARVYYDVPGLQEAKEARPPRGESTHDQRPTTGWTNLVKQSGSDFYFYLRHRAFLPSIAGAVLYLTVLSFAGQMVTYLLSIGYNSTQIGIARTLSVVFEVSMLMAGIAVFWTFETNSLLFAGGLVGGTILSRLGLRGFDLCVQFIVQKEVKAESRGAFSSVEAAWRNGFELVAYATTIIWSRPEQFKWPSLNSVIAVAAASVAYTTYVYLTRGHLLHLDALTSFLRSKQ
ncbi:Ferroportin1 domain-containing protein [Trichoderma afarasin]